MLVENLSLRILKPIRNLGSDNRIRCFGSDATNIIRVESKLNLLSSKGVEKCVVENSTTCTLPRDNIPGFSDISVAEISYMQRILKNLMKQEIKYSMTAGWLEERKTLINWLALLQIKMKLSEDSLYLAVSLLNRSLPTVGQKPDTDLELMGIVCLWMAAKIEETKVPGLRHWCRFGRGYQQKEIIETEENILQ